MRNSLISLVVLGIIVGFAGTASAAVVEAGQQYTVASAYPGAQGPFLMTQKTDAVGAPVAAADAIVFDTFCTEINEHFAPSSTTQYEVATLSFKSSATNRTLQDYGAWAYWKYATSYAVHTAVNSSATLADALQKAIWWSMKGLDDGTDSPDDGKYREWEADVTNASAVGTLNSAGWSETGTFNDPGTGVVQTAVYTYAPNNNVLDAMEEAAEVAAWLAGGARSGNDEFLAAALGLDYATYTSDPGGNWATEKSFVKVLEITDVRGRPKQDMIAYTGTGTFVPEPASLLMWSLLGGAGLAASQIRRRRAGWSKENRQAIRDVVARR